MRGLRFVSSISHGAMTIGIGAQLLYMGAERLPIPLPQFTAGAHEVYGGLFVIAVGLVVFVSNAACLIIYGE